MALFTSCTDANKVTHSAKKLWYSYETKFWPGQFDSDGNPLSATHITRHITKQYEYVGLTESAAKAQCQPGSQGTSTKLDQYTKITQGWVFNPTNDDGGGIFKPVSTQTLAAEISAQYVAGTMWKLVINVNCVDNVWVEGVPTDLPSAFPANKYPIPNLDE